MGLIRCCAATSVRLDGEMASDRGLARGLIGRASQWLSLHEWVNTMGLRHRYGLLLAILLAIAASPSAGATSAEEYYTHGIELVDIGNYQEAIAYFENAIKLAPKWAAPKNGMGIAQFHQGNYAAAIIYYDEAISLDPMEVAPWNNKGLALDTQGNFAAAITAFDRAIALDSSDAASWNNKGISLSHQGSDAAAIECYNKAIERDSTFAAPWDNKGNVLAHQGNYAEAIECYDRALQLDPTNAKTRYNKGLAFYNQGNYAAAIKAYDKVLELNPTHPQAQASRDQAIEALQRSSTTKTSPSIIATQNVTVSSTVAAQNATGVGVTQSAGQSIPSVILVALAIGAVGLEGVWIRRRK